MAISRGHSADLRKRLRMAEKAERKRVKEESHETLMESTACALQMFTNLSKCESKTFTKVSIKNREQISQRTLTKKIINAGYKLCLVSITKRGAQYDSLISIKTFTNASAKSK